MSNDTAYATVIMMITGPIKANDSRILSRRNSLLSRLAKASMSDNQAHKPLRWVAFLPVSLADCVCGVVDLICSPFA